MPTYQYRCTECGGQLEAVQKFTDEPLTVHEDCGGRLRKVFSPVGIVFKGSGFYKTDSRGSGSPGSSAEKSEKSEKSDASSSSPASDSSSATSSKSDSASSSAPSTDTSKSSSAAKSSSSEKVA